MKNGHTTRQKTPAGRYALLDELRGLDLVSMMLYHACWDLVFLFGVEMKWYAATPGHLWQQSICWVFILLSGFCVPLGHHTLRRGATVFGAGVLITAVTLLFMPEDRVVFGVLTLLGSAMLLNGLLEPLLKKVPPAVGLAVAAVLFAPIMRRTTTSASVRCGWPCRKVCMPTTSRPIWVFTRGGSILPIISRWCRGCFCSGAAISCTGSWAAHAWNRCAVRSAPRLAGWGGIRWCCICCISRSSLGCFGSSSKFFTKKA